MAARHSCFLYWDPIVEEPLLHAFVPEALVSVLKPLYEARQREVIFETGPTQPREAETHVGTHFDSGRGVAWVTLDHVTNGALDGIQAAISAMAPSASAATVFVDLPIDEPGCASLAENLMHHGLRLAGIGPRFRKVDDDRRAEDVLRLQLNVAPVDIAGLVVEGDLGRALADQVVGS